MDTVFTFILVAVTSFFTLINPLSIMPVFISMTGSLSTPEKRKTAKKATVIAFITLILFAVSGQFLFRFFGISVNSFKVVGGVIFFLMGHDMLQARLTKVKHTESEAQDAYVNDISITPLAIPLLCGPGAITNAIVLMEEADSIQLKFALIVSISIVLLTTYVVLRYANQISDRIGETGNKVLMRLMGLIVMVIAVEFFFSGLTPIIQNIIN
jgi:multiple antibiotic resistance protein